MLLSLKELGNGVWAGGAAARPHLASHLLLLSPRKWEKQENDR